MTIVMIIVAPRLMMLSTALKRDLLQFAKSQSMPIQGNLRCNSSKRACVLI
jgi:hypothetical protein